jgi:hypothetical protein
VPHVHRPVVSGGHDASAVGAEARLVDLLFVSSQDHGDAE